MVNVLIILNHGSTTRPSVGPLSESVRSTYVPLYALIVLSGFPSVVPVQSFLLTIKSEYTDGGMTIIESVPCEAGSSAEFCIVEVCIFAEEASFGSGW